MNGSIAGYVAHFYLKHNSKRILLIVAMRITVSSLQSQLENNLTDSMHKLDKTLRGKYLLWYKQ